jgi:hypothetical protein
MSENFWVNLVGFQLVWWLSILFGNAVIIPVTFILLLHIFFHSQPGSELKVLFFSALLGFSVDISLTLNGVFIFPDSHFPPLWLALLWFGFCATLQISLKYFSDRISLAFLVGGLGGSSTYLAAAKLGAVEFGYGWLSTFLILLVVWTFLYPLLIFLTRRMRREHVAQV